jgi:hypothetical protein
VLTDLGGGRYKVAVLLGYAREIIFVPKKPPECKCTTCVNKRLPCKYFVAVCNLLHVNPKQECYLHPQWKLSRHPVFLEALRNLSLKPEDHGLAALAAPTPQVQQAISGGAETVAQGVVEYGGTFSVPREQYDKIVFPKETFRRHNDLNTLATEVVTLGKRSEHQYKVAMAALAATKVKLMAGHQDTSKPAATADQRGIIMPPATKIDRRDEASGAEAMKVNTVHCQQSGCLLSTIRQLTVT